MAKKPESNKTPTPVPKRGGRDYSQRAHDAVREVEKRHAERHKDDKPEK